MVNIGDVLDIDDAAAKRLIKYGVAEAADGKALTGGKSGGDKKRGRKSGGDKPGDNNPGDDADTIGAEFDIDAATPDEIAQELSLLGVGYKGDETREQLAALLKEALLKKD